MAKQIGDFLPTSERCEQTMRTANKSWHDAQAEREQEAEHHEKRMKRLWVVMTQTYGTLWPASFGEKPNPMWTKALAPLNDYQIKRGIGKAIASGREHPAKLPEFIAWCLGDYADHKLMDPEEAYQAACRGEYWHRGIHHAVTACGGAWAFRRMSESQGKPAFLKAWKATLEALQHGKTIRLPPVAPPDAVRLAQPEIKQRDIELGMKAMAQIKATLGMSTDLPEEQAEDLPEANE